MLITVNHHILLEGGYTIFTHALNIGPTDRCPLSLTYLVARRRLFLTGAPADNVVVEEAGGAAEERGLEGGASGRGAAQPETGAVGVVFEKSLGIWFLHVLHGTPAPLLRAF